MAKIDVFNHIYPPKYYNFFEKKPSMVGRMSNDLQNLTDFNSRVSVMDRLGIDREILSLAIPCIDNLHTSPEVSREVTKAANDSMAEVVEDHPDRFLAVGTLSLSDPEFAVEESERCIRDLKLLGIQIMSNVKGDPIDLERFDAFYTTIEKLEVPLWLHPTFMRDTYKWLGDFRSDIMVGWDFDTTLSVIRLAGSGLMDRHKRLKVIVHHLGSLIPILAGRISLFLTGSNGDHEAVMRTLKSFYVDTSEGMWMPWLEAALDFFGVDHLMFGTDYPWGNSAGIIDNIEQLKLSDAERDLIYNGNAARVIGMK